MRVKIKLVGNRPLMMHNGRLANPLDQWTVKLKSLTGKKKKTDEDLILIMRAEARGGAYETPGGKLGIPTAAVFASLFQGAKNYKLGVQFKKAVRYEEGISPLKIKGKEIDAEKFLKNPDNIDYRAVVVSRSKVMRSRPIIKDVWESVHELELDESVADLRTLKPVFDYAGKNIGLLEMRPTLGTYKVEVVSGSR